MVAFRSVSSWLWPMLLLAAIMAALSVGWVGYTASDDSLYFRGAERWLTAPPWPGDDHWSTRFPLLWSFAAMLAVFGYGFAAFAATALSWYAVLVAVSGLVARRLGGARAGWIAALLTATLPVVVMQATTVSVDLLETSLLIAGAWLLGDTGTGKTGLWRGMIAGLCFGAAILCRETSLLAMTGLAMLFVAGRPVRRDVLLAAAVGIVLVLGGEALFQGVMTGHPFRRYDIAFHHDSHIDRAANLEGNFLIHPVIDPVLVLLVNDDFGLLFWVAAFALWQGRRSWWRKRPTLVVIATMALADFVLVSVLAHKLVLNPRYFMLPAITAVILVSLWAARLRGRALVALLLTIVATDLLLLSVGNAHPRWEMEALVAAQRAYPGEAVSGDPVTVRRARQSFRFAGLRPAHEGAASSGGLELVPQAAAAGKQPLAVYPSPSTRLGTVLTATGLSRAVPKAFRHRLFSPGPTMVLIRR